MDHTLDALVRQPAKLRLEEVFPSFFAEAIPLQDTDTFLRAKEQLLKEELASSYARIVLINGSFDKELSHIQSLPKSLIILPLSVAAKVYPLALKRRWQKGAKDENDPYALLNACHFQDGLFLYVPPHLHIEEPLEILSFFTQNVTPRIHLFMGENSSVTISKSHRGSAKSMDFFDIVLEPNARLEILEDAEMQDGSFLYQNTRAQLKKDAFFQQMVYSEGNSRQNVHVQLEGEGSNTVLKGLAYLTKEQQDHTHIRVDHLVPYCTSRQYFKKVLQDKSSSLFEGKIYVQREAQKTQAYQLSQNFLLSPHAKAKAEPNLEIFADDVKASHGATFLQYHPDELFYLRSRGLTLKEAQSILLKGFCKEIFHKEVNPIWRERILRRFHAQQS